MLSAAAAVVNCLIEKQIDAKMARTAGVRCPLKFINKPNVDFCIFWVLLDSFYLSLLLTALQHI